MTSILTQIQGKVIKQMASELLAREVVGTLETHHAKPTFTLVLVGLRFARERGQGT